jgi:hypothetical protein
VTQLFMEALSSFSSDFNGTLLQAGGQFSGMGGISGVPAANISERLSYLQVRAQDAGDKATELSPLANTPRQATDNSMSYADIGSFNALASPTLGYASMINSAGSTVQVSTDTVQSAMDDFRSAVLDGETTSLFNGNGSQSYPMSFMHYLTTNTSRVTTDCYSIEQYLEFLSWTQYWLLLHSLVRQLFLLFYRVGSTWELRTKQQVVATLH